jgi:hypothetical protein
MGFSLQMKNRTNEQIRSILKVFLAINFCIEIFPDYELQAIQVRKQFSTRLACI